MFQKRLLSAIAALAVLMSAATVRLSAQSVTTGAVGGTITDTNNQPIQGAQIQVRNNKTGTSSGGLSRATGQYIIQGIEPDNDYSITVRRIGYVPANRDHFRVALSQTAAQDFSLIPQTNILSTVQVTGSADPIINPAHTGASMTFDDSTLHRLPSLNRNFVDFVSSIPQVSTATGYMSAGAVNIRQNAIQIDGAGSGDFFGLGATGQPGSQANAKLIPLDAVKEFQILLSPYDVREGNFGGMLINAVTKSGTNTFHGAAYGYTRDAYLTRKVDYLHQFSQQQYGFSLSGPIIKDRLFFFINPEFQKFQTPTSGAYIGSSDNFVAQSSIDALNTIMTNKYGFADAGTGAQVLRKNPLTNVFGRIDAYLPLNTRLVLRHNFIQADNLSFGRSIRTAASPNFGLTSNQYEFSSKTNSSVAEILTNLPHGMFNEMLLSISNTHDFRTVPVTFPQVTVRGIPRSDTTGTAQFVFGTEASSQGNVLNQRTFEFTENFTFPVNNHSFTIGTKDQYYRSYNLFGQNSLGAWTFQSLDSLNGTCPTCAGTAIASSYAVSAPATTDPSNGIAIILANMYGIYGQDVWQATPDLTITGGARWDIPHFITRPPLNQSVVNVYGRATSTVPHKLTFSPRFAFNWDVTGDLRNQLRGGIGYFTGNPPFVYLSNAYGNTALSGFAALTCGNTAASLHSPVFNAANIAKAPTACADFTSGGVTTKGATTSLSSNINTIDPQFRFPQYQKITTAFDHKFRNGFVGTMEGLYTKAISNPFYQNLALAGIQGIGPHGRVMYGTQTASGANPVYKNSLTGGGRTTVLDVTDVSGDYSYSLTGSLAKTFFTTFESSLAYTYSQARNIADVTSSTAGSNYRYQRDTYGSLADRKLQRAKNDQPHKVVAMGTWRLRTLTDLSVVYSGNSGAPYDYVYLTNFSGNSGDTNGDGQSQNDLIYVPTDSHNPSEILFTGYNGNAAAQASAAAQADALEAFIKKTPCLRNNRGLILNRNVCRNPWQNEWDVSAAQSLQAFGRQNLQLRLDVINFGNLLNHKWGRQLFSDQGSTCGSICSATGLLTQTGNVLGATPAQAVGVYTFDPTLQRFSGLNASSNYRMQLSMRYSF
jgi:Carboxypeptidase regulatory-like domain